MVIAEDSLIVREGLQQLLSASPTIDVVAVCGDLVSLREAIERERPDVVLTDIRMPSAIAESSKRVKGTLMFLADEQAAAPH